MNVCTVSYSAAYWNWTRWEIEIDWMALNGINLPLSFTGQEYVVRKVFNQFGVSNMDDFFPGSAFLAWQRMGNFQQWGGPLSSQWIEHQAALQKMIFQRQRNFGMVNICFISIIYYYYYYLYY